MAWSKVPAKLLLGDAARPARVGSPSNDSDSGSFFTRVRNGSGTTTLFQRNSAEREPAPEARYRAAAATGGAAGAPDDDAPAEAPAPGAGATAGGKLSNKVVDKPDKPGKVETKQPGVEPGGPYRFDELGDSATEQKIARAMDTLASTEAGAPIAAALRAGAEIRVTDDPNIDGSYNAEENLVTLDVGFFENEDSLVRVLAHEGQHHVQDVQGTSEDLNKRAGEGRGGSDASDGTETDALIAGVQVGLELGHTNFDGGEQLALNDAGTGTASFEEVVERRRESPGRGKSILQDAVDAGERVDTETGAQRATVTFDIPNGSNEHATVQSPEGEPAAGQTTTSEPFEYHGHRYQLEVAWKPKETPEGDTVWEAASIEVVEAPAEGANDLGSAAGAAAGGSLKN